MGASIDKTEIFERAVLMGDVRMLDGRDDLWQNRRSVRIRVAALTLVALAVRPSTALGAVLSRVEGRWRHLAIALDDLTRKYQDLVKRAADLRSYL